MLVGRPFRRELQGVAMWRNPDGSIASLLDCVKVDSQVTKFGRATWWVLLTRFKPSEDMYTKDDTIHWNLPQDAQEVTQDKAEWSRHRMNQTSRASLPIKPKPQSCTAHASQPPATQGKRAVAEPPPANNSFLKNRRSLPKLYLA